MKIGVPREIKQQEYRVAALPSGAYQLIKRGHQVIVERGAGVGAGYPDAEYETAGAKMVEGLHGALLSQERREVDAEKADKRSEIEQLRAQFVGQRHGASQCDGSNQQYV